MGKTIERKPTNVISKLKGYINIFLAGSIEQGVAENWQDIIVKSFSDEKIIFYNPRRESWDSTWVQSIDNKIFSGQVDWELTALELSDLIVMYFDPSTKSPISLLELGLYARGGKLVVLCPDSFWRKGNVDVVCQYYSINQVATFDDLVTYIKDYVQNKTK